ncbi:hypothetical protein [Aeoliella mucimassa]|uniref:Uncharacterized protein n=1 Tax=Aeoliella mucimassa TaxID=2527972 RepID=A0A518AT54_9BACT|nr:hypothetical protein [Aeoliella mucimassa]QDU57902.1 hypothetical protein Pan181_41250 [Aeoliella mucimassa]
MAAASRLPVPESLAIAVDDHDRAAIERWWNELTAAQQAEFLEVATYEPDRIATRVDTTVGEGADPYDEWYEYLVNQDLRFYFDRSQPIGSYNVVFPILQPLSVAADIKVVSHLLTRGVNPDRAGSKENDTE